MTKKTSTKNKNKACATKCTTKNPSVYRQGSLRYTKLNNAKFFFVSDLVGQNGRAFVDRVQDEFITMRIKDNNNSQTRRLLAATRARALKLV